jgi:hypothetical protein
LAIRDIPEKSMFSGRNCGACPRGGSPLELYRIFLSPSFLLGHCFPAPEWNRRSKYGMASRHKRVRAFRAVAKIYLLHIQGRRSNKSRFVELAEIVAFHFQSDPSALRPVKHLRNA